MKTIKPLKLGVLQRTFEHNGRCMFVPTVILFFPFESPSVPLQDINLWKLVAEEIGGESAFDEAMHKVRGEVLITGNAYPRGGEPAPACAVRVQLGSVDKQLYVVGDRVWKYGVATEPEPFTEMPVRWSRAFGGDKFPKNPIGRGFAPFEDDSGKKVHPLPNVEHPHKLVRSPDQRPDPVGFGAMDLTWPQRFTKVGTYDKKWLEEVFPGFAEDIDWTFFNTAPKDQWIEGYFKGDESFVIENMHPAEPRIESRLPNLLARCFITRRGKVDELEEVILRIDTVHLFPHHKRGAVFFRGLTEVEEDDAADVVHWLVACERPGEPKPLSHYQKVLAQRLDKKTGAVAAIRDSDLMPDRDPDAPPVGHESLGDMEGLLASDNLIAKNFLRRAQLELDATRAQLSEMGLDPDEHGVPREVPPFEGDLDMEKLPEIVDNLTEEAEKARVQATEQRDKAVADARTACEAVGLDFDEILAAERKKQGGPPKFSAEEEMRKLHDQLALSRNTGVHLPETEKRLADPELLQRFQTLEKQLVDAYRKFGYFFPAASRLDGEEAARLRREVERALSAGESLAGRDLTGADLAGMEFRGTDMHGVYLEAADLSGCRFEGADLTEAVLTRADLSDAVFPGAKVTGIGLGQAILHRTDLSGGLDLTGATFGKAELIEVDLSDAILDRADFMDVSMRSCKLDRVKASGLMFISSDGESGIRFAEASWSGCELRDSCFLFGDVQGADFSRSQLQGTVFLGVKGDGAIFDDADCTSLRLVHGCSFPGARFHRTKLDKANLRGTDLKGADFSMASLEGADLSECDLEGARFYRAVARRALMIKANLTGADLTSIDLMEGLAQKADLTDAVFRGANLFRVDFSKVKVSRATQFEDANMKYISFVRRKEVSG